MAKNYLRLERLDRFVRVTIDRQEAMNALNSDLLVELVDTLERVAADPEIRAVILTGAGDKAFVAGADIKEMVDKSPGEAREFSRLGHRVTRTLEEMDKVVIAAVNGVALGGGCELALACDLRIASERAKLGQPELKLGIIPGWGATARLARLVGEGIAKEMIFTGRVLSAAEALRVGLVNMVVAPEALAEEATNTAITIAGMGPLAIASAKRSLHLSRTLDSSSASELEADLFALAFATEDQREGMQAFIDRRQPAFRGR